MFRSLSFVLLVTLAVLTGCTSEGKNSQDTTGENLPTVTISHDLDTVEVPVKPQRVVALDFGALENLDLIDANVVGIPKTGVPAFLSEYENDVSIENLGNLVEVNLEKVNELQPNLIIIGGRLSESYEDISQIAPTVQPALSTEQPIEALEENLKTLGKIFDREGFFDQELQAVKQKVDSVRSLVQEQPDQDALVVLHNRGRFSAYGSGSRFGIVHDILGVKETVEDLDAHLHGTRVSNEFIQQANPDILFIVDRSAAIGDQPLNKSEIENQLIRQTNAYKSDKIIYLNPDAWYLSAGGGVESINIMLDEVAQAF